MEGGSEFWEWFVIISLNSFALAWLPVYCLRHRHRAFMWIHREFYLNIYLRRGAVPLLRFLSGLLLVVGTAAAMHMYFSSPSDNERHYNNFKNNF